MKRCSIFTFTMVVAVVSVVFGGPSLSRGMGQQPAADTGNKTDLAKAETAYVLAEFTDGLNGKKLKPGARVRVEVAQDVLAHGKIIIPVDARIEGHVTEVKTRGTDPESRLGIVFDKVLLKHHEERNLQGVVYALAAPSSRRSKVDEPDQMLAPSMGVTGGTPMPMGSKTTTPTRMSRSPILTADSSSASITSAQPNSAASRNGDGDIHANSGLIPPISVGIPPGVYRLKGFSLTSGASADTPGPVILSTGNDVKLDYGTQIIIKVADTRDLRP
ncbi:MAG TPA: hypothetical protein VKH81_11015 [Candidatus Angelobacter sp.]|nr:hypothetical protein [Candidatus Angelobacter sp.]